MEIGNTNVVERLLHTNSLTVEEEMYTLPEVFSHHCDARTFFTVTSGFSAIINDDRMRASLPLWGSLAVFPIPL